jgi:hypothetical protein
MTPKCVNWSSHLTTNHPFGPSREQVKWKILFFVARQKTVVATVVGNGKMQNPTKYGAKIQIFPFENPKP